MTYLSLLRHVDVISAGDWTFVEKIYFPEDDPCHSSYYLITNSDLELDHVHRCKMDEDADVDESEDVDNGNDYDMIDTDCELRMERIVREGSVVGGIMKYLIPFVGTSVIHLSFAGCLKMESEWVCVRVPLTAQLSASS